MKIEVLLFGVLAEKAGRNTLEAENMHDLDALKRHLFNSFPGIENLAFQVAVNQELVTESVVLKDGDEVAFLPPFAGG